MDVGRLRQGEQIAAIAALVLLFVMFVFNWFTVDIGGGNIGGVSIPKTHAGVNAWESFSWIDLILFLGVIGGLALAFVRGSGTRVDFPLPTAVTGVCALGTLLVLYRIINPPGNSDLVNRGIGLFLGLIAVAALTYGAYLIMQEDEGGLPSGTGRREPPAPPPGPPPAR
jgi:hypothetical protein